MKKLSLFKKILGPSPLLYGATHLFFRGGSDDGQSISDKALFELMIEENELFHNKNKPKPRRLSEKEVQRIMNTSQSQLNPQQRLLQSVIKEALTNKELTRENFENLEKFYETRSKYKGYLRIKRIFPIGIIGSFTNAELTKMAYAKALGCKSISLTLPGLIGYALPAYYFWHMGSFDAPDRLKPFCNFCKITLGAPFWVANYVVDGLMETPEEFFFGEPVPIDVMTTGGTIPADIGDIKELNKMFFDAAEEMQSLSKKTY